MTLLPLVLSAPNWDPSGAPDGRQPSSDGAPDNCGYCGFRAPGWMETSRGDDAPATACILCHLCHSLDRPTIEAEAVLIWLPEMSQAALIAITRRLHVICYDHGAAPTMDCVPPVGSAQLSQAWGVYAALLRRSVVAEKRLGSRTIRDLAEALAGVTTNDRVRATLLGGVRLLPRGRFHRDGIDIYPALLSAIPRPWGAVA